MRSLVTLSLLGAVAAVASPVEAQLGRFTIGGGGAFTSAAVGSGGTALVGSDLSGLYRRTGSTGDWTPIGDNEGLRATAVDVVMFEPGSNSVALAGTRRGLYRTTNGGQSWSPISISGLGAGDDVTAIGWSPTSDVVYIATTPNGPSTITNLWKSSNDGQSFGSEIPQASHLLPTTVRIVKIVVDPNTTDGSELYVLSGADLGRPGADKALYRSTSSGTNFSNAGENATGGSDYAIDVAVVDSLGKGDVVIMTTSNDGPPANDPDKDDREGKVYWSGNNGTSWSQLTIATSMTGAIWFNNGDLYILNVQKDACGTVVANQGLYKATSLDWDPTSGTPTITAARVDNGQGSLSSGGVSGTSAWENGWVDCTQARGRKFNNVATALSTRGEYWVTAQFVYHYVYGSSERRYSNSYTYPNGSAPFVSKGIENVNAIVIKPAETGTVWAGYYDLGLLKSTGGTWTLKNPNAWGKGGYGGNVTGIVLGSGSTLFATMARTSKADTVNSGKDSYLYNLWKTTDGGSSWAVVGDLPQDGFLWGLTRQRGGSRMYVTRNGRAYYSDNEGINWTAVSGGLPTSGIYVLAGNEAGSSSKVYAGGSSGLWDSSNNGTTWTQVTRANDSHCTGTGDCDFNYSATPGDVGDDDPSTTPEYALHRYSWNGIHQILFDEDIWFVGYAASGSGGINNRLKGLWRTRDGGSSYQAVIDSVQRRGVAIDSCSRRLWVTSGAPTAAGLNDDNDNPWNRAVGVAYYQLKNSPAGEFDAAKRVIQFGSPYRFGAAVVTADADTRLYASIPGLGIWGRALTAPFECSTEFHAGGDGEGASAEPQGALEPTTFRLVEVRGRTFYDLAGRKVRIDRAGVYFDPVVSGGKVVRRRTVIVTP